MHHIAILKKSWRLLEKISQGHKIAESRWFKIKARPWNNIKAGDLLYFKETGAPITLCAVVSKVLQISELTPERVQNILKKYGASHLGITENAPEFLKYVEGKNYCLIVFFQQVQHITPFAIDKSGFGSQCAWISIDDVQKIKIADNLR